jgi:hypothetical protein
MLTNGWGIDSWQDASGVYHSIDMHPDDIIFTDSTGCDGEAYTGLWWEHGVTRSAERMVAFVQGSLVIKELAIQDPASVAPYTGSSPGIPASPAP